MVISPSPWPLLRLGYGGDIVSPRADQCRDVHVAAYFIFADSDVR